MSGSTFAGKSTTDTIRNYAEMLIDDLNSNFPERGAEHWDKAREIDNKKAKQIFGQEYSDRIGEAYYNCINNYQELELIELKEELDVILKRMSATNSLALSGTFIAKGNEIKSKFDFIMGLVAVGISICPQSADLHYAAAQVCITHNGADGKWIPKATNFINAALGIQPGHTGALQARETVALMKRKAAEKTVEPKSSCFIATAAYGTPFAKEIDVLRNWRDEVLETSYPGRLFIKTYYTLSPPVADNISDSSIKRKAVRTVLGPIVKILKNNHSN